MEFESGCTWRTTFLHRIALIPFFAFLSLTGFAQPNFQDDFEEGVGNFSQNVINNGIQPGDRNVIPSSGSMSGKISASNDRAAAIIASPVDVSVPGLFTVYINADSLPVGATGPSRVQTAVGPNTFSGSSVGIGWFNNATGFGDSFDGARFQGKHTGSGGSGWFNLNNPGTPLRSPGWHKFNIERLSDGTYRFYVDDVLGRSVGLLSGNSWSNVILGLGVGTQAGEAWFDGVHVTTEHPSVLEQPTNFFASLNGAATFSVVATNLGGPDSELNYQWKFNVTNILAGETNSTLTLTNVGTNHLGFYSVVISNRQVSIGSAAAQLTIAAPSIITNSSSREVLQGGYITNTVTASGVAPLFYQWKKEGTDISGATTSAHPIPNAQPFHAGAYTCTVSNAFGTAETTNIVLAVIPKPSPAPMEVLWRITVGTNGWLMNDSTARGLAYSPASNHVYVVSRKVNSAGAIYVLDGDTGTLLQAINPDPLVPAGGIFTNSMIAVGDDNAIYVANLTTDGTTVPFQVYRYTDYLVDGQTNTVTPEIVWVGDPGAGIANRWGDTMDVRGSGAATEILLSSRNKTHFAILNPGPVGGPYPAPIVINVTNAMNDDFGLGLSFGTGNTFWAKTSGKPLRHIAYDGTILHSYSNLLTIGVIAVDPANSQLAANGMETPDSLRLYDISNLEADPVLLDFEFYNYPTKNSAFGTGRIEFGANGRVYALDEAQGIIAWAAPVPDHPVLTFSHDGSTLTLSWTDPLAVLQQASSLGGSVGEWSDVEGATNPHPVPMLSGSMFFRLRK